MMDLDPWSIGLDGTRLIEASAGTGKTHALTTLYLRLLVEEDLLPSEILVVTYTHAATAELRDRVRARIREAIDCGEPSGAGSESAAELRDLAGRARALGQRVGKVDPLRRALREFDEAAIFTIHGFCQRTLQEHAFESGMAFDAELIEDSEPMERTLVFDLWSRILEAEDADFVEWLRYGAGRRWKFEPATLQREILGQLGADEDMPVLPNSEEVRESREWAVLRVEAEAAWIRWAEVWAARRETVSGILLGKNDLNKGSYKPATIEAKWFPRIDDWATTIANAGNASSMNATPLPTWWKNLVPEGLRSRLKKDGQPVEDAFFDACGEVQEAVSRIDEARRARALALRVEFVVQAREEARKRREQRHLLFFDDLLCQLRSALRPPEGERLVGLLRRRYRFALIDEFQDTDPVQYEIFRRVWHDSKKTREGESESEAESVPSGLFLIGDPKQAIYSFRGADVFTYLRAREDAGEGLHGLAVNWRSSARLIAAVNALFSQPERPFGLESIEFNEVRPRPDAVKSMTIPNRSVAGLRVLMAHREDAIAMGLADESAKKGLPLRFGRTTMMQSVARDVADLLDAGGEIDGRPIRPSDIAVLCRRKIELAQSRRALESLGIPCVDRGDSDVFDSREAWELLSVLRAWLRPGDPTLVRAALSTGAHGFNAQALRKLSDDGSELVAIAERFAEYARAWSQSGFGFAFDSWRRNESVSERLLDYQDGDRRLTNWLHLAELLQRVEHDRATSRIGLAAWLERAIASSEARSEFGGEASLLRLESDDQAISLVTLHRSKGLEYEIVYLPSLWEEASARAPSVESAKDEAKSRTPVRFHDEKSGKRTLDLGGPDPTDYTNHVARSAEESVSEQFRLLYVGLTRARQQCVVAWGAMGTAYAKAPLAWLLHAGSWEDEDKARDDSPKELKKWTDEQWTSAWQSVAGVADREEKGAIAIEKACFEKRDRWCAPQLDFPELNCEKNERVLGRPLITTSFSALVRNEHHRELSHRSDDLLVGPAVTGRDRDDSPSGELVDYVESTKGIEAAGMPIAATEDGAPDLAAAMHEFPRGAEAGTLLHDVLEKVDFASYDPAVVETWAEQASRRGRLGVSDEGRASHVAQIVHVVRSVAHTPLRPLPDPFCLADLKGGQQRPEIEFTLAALAGKEKGGFSPLSLGQLLAEAPKESPLQRYATRVSRMGWHELKGYLRGFIDSIFHDGERYFLIDYKSTHLGTRQADYFPERLVQPMIDHDYVLQYLIYAIALDRHLSLRLEDYDYDEHFGGVYYLFLRGLSESHERGCGIFFDRPPREIIERAGALLGAGTRGVE
jgi:exodeoxyribonuclease V beta subunit